MNNTIVEYKIKNNNSSLGVEILDFEYDPNETHWTPIEEILNIFYKV